MDFEGKETEIIFWVVVVMAAALIWHFFLRRRCPECKSTKYSLQDKEEIDRWMGTKKVEENLSGGKKKTKVVNTTFVKNKYTYICETCGHVWSEVKKEEKE